MGQSYDVCHRCCVCDVQSALFESNVKRHHDGGGQLSAQRDREPLT